jgi:hypothetical protein
MSPAGISGPFAPRRNYTAVLFCQHIVFAVAKARGDPIVAIGAQAQHAIL